MAVTLHGKLKFLCRVNKLIVCLSVCLSVCLHGKLKFLCRVNKLIVCLSVCHPHGNLRCFSMWSNLRIVYEFKYFPTFWSVSLKLPSPLPLSMFSLSLSLSLSLSVCMYNLCISFPSDDKGQVLPYVALFRTRTNPMLEITPW